MGLEIIILVFICAAAKLIYTREHNTRNIIINMSEKSFKVVFSIVGTYPTIKQSKPYRYKLNACGLQGHLT